MATSGTAPFGVAVVCVENCCSGRFWHVDYYKKKEKMEVYLFVCLVIKMEKSRQKTTAGLKCPQVNIYVGRRQVAGFCLVTLVDLRGNLNYLAIYYG